MESLTVLDLVIMVILIFTGFKGIQKGLIGIILDLVALIGGIFVAFTYYEQGAVAIQSAFGFGEATSIFVSFLGIWGALYGAAILLAKLSKPVTKVTMIRPFDVIGGGLLGSIKGFCMLLPLLIPLSHTDLQIYHESKIARPLNQMIYHRLPKLEDAKTFLTQKTEPHDTSEENKQTIKSDPELERLQQALESGKTNQVGDLLGGLE